MNRMVNLERGKWLGSKYILQGWWDGLVGRSACCASPIIQIQFLGSKAEGKGYLIKTVRVCVCMCMSVYVCICACEHVCAHLCMCRWTCACLCVHACAGAQLCVYCMYISNNKIKNFLSYILQVKKIHFADWSNLIHRLSGSCEGESVSSLSNCMMEIPHFNLDNAWLLISSCPLLWLEEKMTRPPDTIKWNFSVPCFSSFS